MIKHARELILEKTFLLLLEKGYERISVSDIQKSLGMSRGLLYRYFKNKDELVESACRSFFVDRFILSEDEMKKLSFFDSLVHMHNALISLLDELEKKYGKVISVLQYNMLYADVIMHSEAFKITAYTEFSKAREIVEKAKACGEIRKEFSTQFILNVTFDILDRVSSAIRVEDEIRRQILSDVREFYDSIKVIKTAKALS